MKRKNNFVDSLIDGLVDLTIEETRKQTAKEILQKLKDKIEEAIKLNYNRPRGAFYLVEDVIHIVYVVAKEYGVEVV